VSAEQFSGAGQINNAMMQWDLPLFARTHSWRAEGF
jgi:hypothetical protein